MGEQPVETPQYRIETIVEEYKNRRKMKKGIQKYESEGWSVQNINKVDNGYGFVKTCCLGAIFLPLALFGRKPQTYLVTYQRKVPVEDHPT